MALDPLTAGIGLVDKFIGKFVKDKDLAAKLSAEARSQEFEGEIALLTGQMAINQAEASNPSLWVSGWRPFVGWICGLGLMVKFIILPIGSWIAVVGFQVSADEIPQFSIVELLTLLAGMLGLAKLRTDEKVQGVQRDK